jgi:hypothetical protein
VSLGCFFSRFPSLMQLISLLPNPHPVNVFLVADRTPAAFSLQTENITQVNNYSVKL